MAFPARIGFLGQGWSPDPGGIETHTRALAAGLLEAGAPVSALAFGRRPARERVEGVEVTRAPRPPAHTLDDLDGTRAAQAALLEWLRRTRPDLVLVHHLSGWGTRALELLDAHAVPFAVTLHDDWLVCPRGQRWHAEHRLCAVAEPEECARCLARSHPGLGASAAGLTERIARASEALARALLVATPSETLRGSHLRSGIEVPIEVHPLGIESASLADEVRALRLPRATEDALRLGYLGSVQPSKGVVELAEAVLASGRADLVLEVHGPRGDYHGDRSAADRLEELAAADGRIRLHPPFDRAALPTVLAALDLVAVPSLWEEGFGLVAREARAAGLPVLATLRGGLAELADDPGVTHLDADRPESWAGVLAGLTRAAVPAAPHALSEGAMVDAWVQRLQLALEPRLAGHEAA